jgi:hypothetical protein
LKYQGDGYIPPDGFFPNEKTAIKIAEAAWLPIYGDSVLNKEKPFKAKLVDGHIRIVKGTVQKIPGYITFGGAAYIEIEKKDCKILMAYRLFCDISNLLLQNNLPFTRSVVNSSDNFYFNGADGKTEAVCLVPYSSNLTYNIWGDDENIGQVKVVSESPSRYYYLKDPQGGASAPWQYKVDSQ